ncbi:GumC family protein [Spirulina subsalsa]|uniref:GumC family protein n=1 Tax=Spirulina subsalsa TaxID=54311 RepID=UPI00037BBDBC|nr:polysaccharide biosynthesis tyrosine autokinase [Spirulina subsalsa]
MVSNLNPQSSLPPGSPSPQSLPNKLILEPPFAPKAEEESLNLRQALSVLRRRWWVMLLVSGAVSCAVGFRVLNEVPLYRSQFRLLIEPIASDESFDQFSQRLIGQYAAEIDYETQIEVLVSPTVINPILGEIQTRYPDMDYNALVSNLGIGRVGPTKILEVSYQDSNPEKIQFVLERVSEGFIEYSQRERKTGNQKGLNFVEEQLPVLQKRVNDLQIEVQQFRQRHNILDPNEQGQAAAGRLNGIREEIVMTQRDLQETQSLIAQLQEQLNVDLGQALVMNALSEAPRYQALLSQLQEIESQIALESARFTPNSPNIQVLQDRRNNLLPLLQAEAQVVLGRQGMPGGGQNLAASPNALRSQTTQQLIDTLNRRQVLTVRQAALSQAEAAQTRQVQNFATLSRQYADLMRELDVATEGLKRFLSVQEDLQIEAARRTISWELLNAPQIPLYPIAPNVPRGLTIGLVAGVLAGAGAALIAEKLDVRFHSPEDLRDAVGLPILGVIPYRKEIKDSRVKDRPLPRLGGSRYRASPFLESFRSLNANLSFFTPDKPLQVLVISSSVPLEGKSTTSINLAQAAAAMGQRVLLVDADLRRPQVHVMTDLPNVWGLSHAISMDIEVEDIIQPFPSNNGGTGGEDNLYVLTSGQIPPDPTRLLSSQKMRSLIDYFRQSFDLVIFDTPPMLGLADAKFLAAQADVMLMVVRLGWTDRAIFKQVIDGLKVSQTSALGLIANGAKDFSSGSYYYYHRYFATEEGASPIDS